MGIRRSDERQRACGERGRGAAKHFEMLRTGHAAARRRESKHLTSNEPHFGCSGRSGGGAASYGRTDDTFSRTRTIQLRNEKLRTLC